MKSDQLSSKQADNIRRRRNKRSPRRTQTEVFNRGRKERSTSLPPVMVRGASAALPAREQPRGKRTRRRFDVTLNTPGAEMRLPSLPMVSVGWRLLSAVLVGLLAFTLYMIWNAPMYKVNMVEVGGLQRLTSEDINSVVNVRDKPIFMVDPAKVRHDLEKAFPELYNISVEIMLPSSVTVKVVERQPVIAWVEDGNEIWVDAAGMAFPKRGDDGPGVVVNAETSPTTVQSGVEGQASIDTNNENKRFLPAPLVSAILAISFQAPENASLLYDHLHGIGWKDKRGWEVYYGMNSDDIDMKLKVYKAIVKQLNKKKIQPSFISVEFVHAPYYRLEH